MNPHEHRHACASRPAWPAHCYSSPPAHRHRRTEADIAKGQVATAQADAVTQKHEADVARSDAEVARSATQAAQDSARQQADELQRQIDDLQAKATDRGLVLTLGDVLFTSGKADLNASATSSLNKLATFLNRHPERSAVIEGHTDSAGSDDYNLGLSQRRADSVKSYLTGQGIGTIRLATAGTARACRSRATTPQRCAGLYSFVSVRPRTDLLDRAV